LSQVFTSKQELYLSYLGTSNYNGTDAGDVIWAAIGKAVMMNSENATVYLNVTKKLSLMTMESTSIKPVMYSCDWTGGDVATTEKTLEPQLLKVETDFCIDELWNTWYSNQKLTRGVENVEPALGNFIATVVAYYLEDLYFTIDDLIWNASTTAFLPPSAFAAFDGLRAKALADATVVEVIGAAPTYGTTLDILRTFSNAIPMRIKNKPGFRIFVKSQVAEFYMQELTAPGSAFTGLTPISATDLSYLSRLIVPVDVLPVGEMYATYSKNIAITTDLDSFENQVRVVDMRNSSNEDKIRIRIKFSLDAGHRVGADVYYYHA
jgi:hypothetical protein